MKRVLMLMGGLLILSNLSILALSDAEICRKAQLELAAKSKFSKKMYHDESMSKEDQEASLKTLLARLGFTLEIIDEHFLSTLEKEEKELLRKYLAAGIWILFQPMQMRGMMH